MRIKNVIKKDWGRLTEATNALYDIYGIYKSKYPKGDKIVSALLVIVKWLAIIFVIFAFFMIAYEEHASTRQLKARAPQDCEGKFIPALPSLPKLPKLLPESHYTPVSERR